MAARPDRRRLAAAAHDRDLWPARGGDLLRAGACEPTSAASCCLTRSRAGDGCTRRAGARRSGTLRARNSGFTVRTWGDDSLCCVVRLDCRGSGVVAHRLTHSLSRGSDLLKRVNQREQVRGSAVWKDIRFAEMGCVNASRVACSAGLPNALMIGPASGSRHFLRPPYVESPTIVTVRGSPR